MTGSGRLAGPHCDRPNGTEKRRAGVGSGSGLAMLGFSSSMFALPHLPREILENLDGLTRFSDSLLSQLRATDHDAI
jgi:hypothetical protein